MREQLGAAGRTCETEVDLFASGFVEESGAIAAVDFESAVAELSGLSRGRECRARDLMVEFRASQLEAAEIVGDQGKAGQGDRAAAEEKEGAELIEGIKVAG